MRLEIMSREIPTQTSASLKFWIGIRGIAQRRSDSGTAVISRGKSKIIPASRTVNTTKLSQGNPLIVFVRASGIILVAYEIAGILRHCCRGNYLGESRHV